MTDPDPLGSETFCPDPYDLASLIQICVDLISQIRIRIRIYHI